MKLSAAMITMVSLTTAREKFHDSVVAYATSFGKKSDPPKLLKAEDKRLLRSVHTEQLAELFFSLRDRGMNSPEKMRGFLSRHNKEMRGKIAAAVTGPIKVKGKVVLKEITRHGITTDRMEKAVVPVGQITMLCMLNGKKRVILDQRTISRILVESMSFSTCRDLIEQLADFGLVDRERMQNCVAVSSNGRLEDLYQAYLEDIRSGIT